MPINKNELSKEMIVKAMQCETAKSDEYIIREKKTDFRYGSKYRSHDLVPPFSFAE